MPIPKARVAVQFEIQGAQAAHILLPQNLRTTVPTVSDHLCIRATGHEHTNRLSSTKVRPVRGSMPSCITSRLTTQTRNIGIVGPVRRLDELSLSRSRQRSRKLCCVWRRTLIVLTVLNRQLSGRLDAHEAKFSEINTPGGVGGSKIISAALTRHHLEP